MRSEPYHDELHTFWGDTKQRRHRRNRWSSCAMDERRCRHDMMIINTSLRIFAKVNKFPKSYLWKWVDGSRSRSEFVGGK